MAEGQVAYFAAGGAVLGWLLKWADQVGGTERRANGKVLALVKKLTLNMQVMNYALSREYEDNKAKTIEACLQDLLGKGYSTAEVASELAKFDAAERTTTLANQMKAVDDAKTDGRKTGPRLPPFAFERTDDFKAKQDRIWTELLPKMEDIVTDNTMSLSKRFTDEFWRYYYDLLKPKADQWHPYIRYQDAERVCRSRSGRLSRAAKGNFWLRVVPFLAFLLTGLLTAFIALMVWPQTTNYYATLAANRLGLTREGSAITSQSAPPSDSVPAPASR
jgi:hypothetical protein